MNVTEVGQKALFIEFETSLGNFEIELYRDHAPLTCTNFATLAATGYYDQTIFHRVINGFMIQGGDPTGTGRGGESIYGGKFKDEIISSLRHTGAGILSMANSGRNTNGSQFFVTLAPTPHLDGKHTIFGRINNGIKTIEVIGNCVTGMNDKPLNDIIIIKAKPIL